MKTIRNTDSIRVLGTTFRNIRDVIAHAVKGEPKDGVYVGEDSKLYPCFDSYDYASENRFYWNFVFATSKEELDSKLEKLKNSDVVGMNYNKFTVDLAPMAYWGGDTCYDVEVSEDIK